MMLTIWTSLSTAFLLLSRLIAAEPDPDPNIQFYADFQKLFEGGALDLADEDVAGTAPSEFFPWSYKPVCSEHIEPPIDDVLCVYTNKTFANGRGISIFTTPSIAEQFAALPPFHDDTALSSQGINVVRAADEVYRAVAIPGKGTGLRAARNIEPGEVITSHTPLLLAYTESLVPPLERERLLALAITQLPVPSAGLYRSLAKVFHKPAFATQDVVAANAFEIAVGGHMHLAVFPEPSRLNHACAPNAQYTLNTTLVAHTVRAARAIPAGEELTVAYTDVLRPTEARKAHLQTSFKFECTCERCSDEDADDARLEEIAELQGHLGDWSAESKGSVKMAEKLVRLYKEGGLDAFLDQAYGHAALAYSAVGSKNGAKKYAGLARESLIIRQGTDAKDLVHWDGLVKEPEAHWSWRRRKQSGKEEL